MSIHYGICAVFIVAALITDLRYMKIPNKLTLPAMLGGLFYQGAAEGWEGLISASAGIGAGFGILLIMYWTGAVGAGDVKLFGGIGAWTGTMFTVQSIICSVMFAGLIGLGILLWRREMLLRIRRILTAVAGMFLIGSREAIRHGAAEHIRFPFMIAVVPGVICTYINYV
ncbi:A24 family peptidase [Paenibacillus sp. JX-17]|uniref:A24 family peptidase n=1 Tax=Paenibacillus lacisoli TaxID=3064525 RepID=A0ABT9CEK8_9BACL|nr:A24 family peptidase [Paenibacillus sp. JX-17]MDO7907300.1 A24 family peptidase [Paenibacillus sp. JX-17]